MPKQPPLDQRVTSGSYTVLLRYVKPYQRGFAVMLLAMIGSGALAVLQPWPMMVLVDQVFGEAPAAPLVSRLINILPGTASRPGLLLWVVAAGIAFFGISTALDTIVTYGWVNIGQRMVYDLALDLFARTQRRSLIYHTSHPVGDSMARIMTDSWCVYGVADAILITPAQAIITAALMIVLMWRSDPRMTIACLLIAPVVGIGTFMLRRRMRKVARDRREIESGMQSHVQQVLSGIRVVQAFAQEQREHERFSLIAGRAIRALQQGVLLTNLSNLWTGLITTIGTGVVLFIGARHVLQGTLTLGMLLVFLNYLAWLQGSLTKLAGTYTTLQSRRAEIDRVMEVLRAPPEVADALDAKSIQACRGEIRIEQVTFGYDPKTPVLSDLSLTIAAGERVAIVGATGAGKSTLSGLIPRFFDPTEGRVLLDGQDLRSLRVRDVRRQVALVLQESFLFPITVAQNIALGRPEATEAEIRQAAEAANLSDMIAQLPDGLETNIGEHGATLSGGQKQRLSIARALLKDAPILILDEPTAALDSGTERLVMDAMRRLMRGRTTIIIAHRLSTIRDADRIVVLEAGRIVEAGSHDELIARDATYARFYHIQSNSGDEASAAAASEGRT